MVQMKIYYGWWIVVATFFILLVCAGIGFSTFPVFFKYLEADMEWNRTSLSIASAIAALAAGFVTPVVGGIIDRHGLRAVMLPGAILLTAAYLMLGMLRTLSELYALNLAVGVGLAATTILPSQTLVSRWFERRRGRAMGIVTTASALGAVMWMPIASRMIETHGWRQTYTTLGIIIGIVSIPLTFLVIRNSPEAMGLRGDEHLASPVASTAPATSAGNEAGFGLKQAMRTRSFWLIVSATFFVIFASSGFGLHAIPFLSDSGLSTTRAATIWAVAQGVSIAARFLFGYLSERYQKRYFAAASNVSRAVSVAVLLLFALHVAPIAVALGLLVVIYGAGMGCNAVTNPLLISETFGVKNFGKIMGILGIPYTIGMAAGMVAGGKLFDLNNDYFLAFTLFEAAFLVAGVSIYFAKPLMLLQRMREAAGEISAGELASEDSL